MRAGKVPALRATFNRSASLSIGTSYRAYDTITRAARFGPDRDRPLQRDTPSHDRSAFLPQLLNSRRAFQAWDRSDRAERTSSIQFRLRLPNRVARVASPCQPGRPNNPRRRWTSRKMIRHRVFQPLPRRCWQPTRSPLNRYARWGPGGVGSRPGTQIADARDDVRAPGHETLPDEDSGRGPRS